MIAAVSVLVKLYVTSSIAINSHSAGHDYTNFLDHAQNILRGEWYGPYNDLTLIKGPGLPIYLAAIATVGISLPLAHQLLFAVATLVACLAFGPIVRNGTVLGIVFVALLFDPFTYFSSSWILNRSQIMDSLALFAVAGGLGSVVRARDSVRSLLPWLALTGLATAGVGLTREDTIWIAAPDLVFLAAYVWTIWPASTSARRTRFALLALPVFLFVGAIATIMSINDRAYGWATTVETTSPAFVSAYQSISRIVVPGVSNRDYPGPRAAREMAYRVSPAAAELKPFFDPTHKWHDASCSTLSLCDDVSAGWFIWAFRDSVAGAGYYANGAKARDFYVRLSKELDDACDDGRLRCRGKSLSLAPAMQLSDIPAIVRFTAEAFWHGVAYDQYVPGAPDPLGPADVDYRDEYQSVVGSAAGVDNVFSGWLLHGRHSEVYLEDPNPGDFLSLAFVNSPDLRDAFGASHEFARDDLDHARFSIVTSCDSNCFIDVADAGKKPVRIPLSAKTIDSRSSGIAYHLDAISVDPPAYVGDAFKAQALAQIVIAYQQVVRPWLLVVLLAIVFRLSRLPRGRRTPKTVRLLMLTAGLAAAVIAHCGVLGVVSGVSFYALAPEYEVAVAPLLLILLALVTAVECEVFLRWLRRRLPSPTASRRRAVAR